MRVELPHGFSPRPYQRAAWQAMDQHKRVILVWHRRAGKDRLCFNKVIVRAAKVTHNAAYYFPDARWGRRAIWDAIDVRTGMRFIDHIPRELVASKSDQEMKVRLVNGSTIQILGTSDLNVVGGNYHTVVFSEYSLQNPTAWDLTRPILTENGGSAFFNGTPRSTNHFYDMHRMAAGNPDWFTQVLTVADTGVISEADLDAERRAGMREALLQQEYFCDWNASLEDAIYGRFMTKAEHDGRIGGFPIDGAFPVHTAWDLGSPRNTSVLYFQVLPFDVVRFVDIDHGLDLNLAERVAYMKAKGYNLGNAYLPHDAAQTARNGLTFQTEAQAAGLANIFVVPPCRDVWPGINRAGSMFGQFQFSTPRCDLLVKALKGYRTLPDTSGGIIRNTPAHTWESHVADALRTYVEADMAGVVPRANAAATPRARPAQAVMGSRRW